MSDTACYRERTNGVYFTRNAHRTDCTDPDCRGCRPCADARHCSASRNCSWHVAEGELTCGRCIASARRDLRWICALAALLMPAAMGDGVDSEAANLAGPTADPEAWTWRKVSARQGRAWHVSLIEDDDEHHPHAVLGIWARMLTEDYEHDMPELATLTWCGAYLDRTLARVAHDDSQDFPQLARELRKCRQHLEAVLHNDDRAERGAPCPACRDAGQLVRLQREYSHWCDNPECQRMHFSTLHDFETGQDVPDDSADVWRCPLNPEHWWTQHGYADLLSERRSA